MVHRKYRVAPSASWVVFVFVVLSPLYSFWLLFFNKILQWGPPLLYFSLKKNTGISYFHHYYLESKCYPFYPAVYQHVSDAGDLISRNNSSTTLPFFRVWTMDAET